MVDEVAHFTCYVYGCFEPVSSITVPMIGPCVHHTDDDVLAESERRRAQWARLRGVSSERSDR